jgi:hypothetical protein
MELRFEKRHYIAGAIIMTAIFMNLFDFAFPSYLKHEGEYTEYVVLFTCGQVINNVSMAIKENTVRSLPVD